MNIEKLFSDAQSKYWKNRSISAAILSHLSLLASYPDHANGWRFVAYLQHQNSEFNESIRSSKKMLEIEPLNLKNLKDFEFNLSQLQNFKFLEPNLYRDVSKGVTYQITELTGQYALCDAIESCCFQILALEKSNLKTQYRYNYRLGITSVKNGRNEKGIKHLHLALPLTDYSSFKYLDPSHIIYLWISKAHLALKNFEKAIEFVDLGFDAGLEESHQFYKADIYKEQGDHKLFKSTLEEFLKNNENKIQKKTTEILIKNKISAQLKLKEFDKAKLAVHEFDNLKPHSESLIKNIEAIRKLIEKKRSIEKEKKN